MNGYIGSKRYLGFFTVPNTDNDNVFNSYAFNVRLHKRPKENK